MDPGSLQLKFGTALFLFSDIKQMKSFLESRCVVRAGRINLHHGDKHHFFTELSEAFLKNIPKGVKVPVFSRLLVMKGGGIKPKRNKIDEIVTDYAEQDD